MKRSEQLRAAAGFIVAVALAGCAQTTVQPEQETSMANLPAPSIVLVHKFSVNMNEVTDTQGLYGRALDAVDQETTSQATAQLAQEVSSSLADELVKQINGLGLPAQRATGETYVPANALVITGYFVDIDAGNKVRQLVIGLGAGKAKIDTQVQVLSPSGSGYRTLLEFKTHADSGEMPGAAVTMGAGAAAQGAVTAGMAAANVAVTGVKAYRTAMGAMASRSADKTAAYLSQFFANQGWISADKVKQPLL
jgi:Domain of unknown function (DUF4410)